MAGEDPKMESAAAGGEKSPPVGGHSTPGLRKHALREGASEPGGVGEGARTGRSTRYFETKLDILDTLSFQRLLPVPDIPNWNIKPWEFSALRPPV